MKFCWCTVTVKNMEESLKFYTEIVGLSIQKRFPAGAMGEIAFLGDGETKVELICNSQHQDIHICEDISLGFEVESADKMLAYIQGKGVEIHSGPFSPNPHVKFFFIQDPNGLKIQFVENL